MGKHSLDTEHDRLPLRLAHEVPGHHRAEVPAITTPLALPLVAGEAVRLFDLDRLPPTEPTLVVPSALRPVSHAEHRAVADADAGVAPYVLRSVLDEVFGAIGIDRRTAPRYRRAGAR